MLYPFCWVLSIRYSRDDLGAPFSVCGGERDHPRNVFYDDIGVFRLHPRILPLLEIPAPAIAETRLPLPA